MAAERGRSEGVGEAGERKKKEQPLGSPFYRCGVVTDALDAVITRVGRIARGQVPLWPHVHACRSNTWKGHMIARDARILCSGVRGI